MKKYDRLVGLIWLILGIGICIGSTRLRLGKFSNPGPGFMPFLAGVIMGISGFILIFPALQED